MGHDDSPEKQKDWRDTSSTRRSMPMTPATPRTRKDSWPPSASRVLTGVLYAVLAAVSAVVGWFMMDWIEGRTVMANTVIAVKQVDEAVEKVDKKAESNAKQIEALSEKDHTFALAIQGIADLLAHHDKAIEGLQPRRRRSDIKH